MPLPFHFVIQHKPGKDKLGITNGKGRGKGIRKKKKEDEILIKT